MTSYNIIEYANWGTKEWWFNMENFTEKTDRPLNTRTELKRGFNMENFTEKTDRPLNTRTELKSGI